jgi:hypothetical protein
MNVPWMDKETVDKYLNLWKTTLGQWKDEVKRAENAWTL